MKVKGFFRENEHLEVYDQASESYYKSIIQEVNDDDIAIGVPMKGLERYKLEEGLTLTFRMVVQDALYYFQSEARGQKYSGNVLLYLISWPDNLERRQRRKFFRISYALEIFFWLLPEGQEIMELEPYFSQKEPLGSKSKGEYLSRELVELLGAPAEGQAIDLSAGGLLLLTSFQLSEGKELLLSIVLHNKEEDKRLLLYGKVVRTGAVLYMGKAMKYRYGIVFQRIDERLRDKVVGFIFELSRQRMS